MSSFLNVAVISSSFRRPVLWAALAGGVLLVNPPVPVYAQAAATQPARQKSAAQRAETVDQRIAHLHAALKITPAQETDWQAVAQTMRDNASAMDKLAAAKASRSEQGMTAVEDLKTYADVAQAHVDGLNKLTVSFEKLYDAMPAPQQKLADEVFLNSRRQRGQPAS